jgi:hypothetical protein
MLGMYVHTTYVRLGVSRASPPIKDLSISKMQDARCKIQYPISNVQHPQCRYNTTPPLPLCDAPWESLTPGVVSEWFGGGRLGSLAGLVNDAFLHMQRSRRRCRTVFEFGTRMALLSCSCSACLPDYYYCCCCCCCCCC